MDPLVSRQKFQITKGYPIKEHIECQSAINRIRNGIHHRGTEPSAAEPQPNRARARRRARARMSREIPEQNRAVNLPVAPLDSNHGFAASLRPRVTRRICLFGSNSSRQRNVGSHPSDADQTAHALRP
jgi:hypothetical protein